MSLEEMEVADFQHVGWAGMPSQQIDAGCRFCLTTLVKTLRVEYVICEFSAVPLCLILTYSWLLEGVS